MLAIHNLTKTYGGLTALDHLTLSIPEGEIFGLLGPNGAGKTTLLRILTGLVAPTGGKVELFGRYAPTQPEVRAMVGYMPQQDALYPGLTVSENIRFFGRMYGLNGEALETRLEEVLALVELSHRRDGLVSTLSGGMTRRAMLASAMVHHPRLLILDEPTSGVDPSLRLRFWGWFSRLVDNGMSILITTHHISEASHCHQVVFLREGRLLEQGEPHRLMKQYGTADLEAAFVQATEQKGPNAPPSQKGGQP
ncbi:MAG: ABC transporter ATP-binding protein [Deltaproteobacteria bacterium]|nr:ABC transporter ATP-binding protein [Deltaproteobacteria bacterium]